MLPEGLTVLLAHEPAGDTDLKRGQNASASSCIQPIVQNMCDWPVESGYA